MEELILELKKQIIEVLNLEDVQPEDIDNDAPLFGEGLGLDSIDALELIVMMKKKVRTGRSKRELHDRTDHDDWCGHPLGHRKQQG